MLRVLLFMFILATTVYAAVDCTNSNVEERRGLPTGLWLIIIIVLPVFGPVAWYALSSSQRRARLAAGGAPMGSSSPTGPQPPSRHRPGRPTSPDDDPEFLWRLEQERRRAARDNKAQAPDDDAPGDVAPTDGSSDDDAPTK